MDGEDELIGLERAGWRALATAGEAAAYYDEVLADEVLFLLPGGLVIDDRGSAIDAMSGTPWDAFELRDERVRAIGPESAAVSYEATAQRGGRRYAARFTSTYARHGGRWRLVIHQQTPLDLAA